MYRNARTSSAPAKPYDHRGQWRAASAPFRKKIKQARSRVSLSLSLAYSGPATSVWNDWFGRVVRHGGAWGSIKINRTRAFTPLTSTDWSPPKASNSRPTSLRSVSPEAHCRLQQLLLCCTDNRPRTPGPLKVEPVDRGGLRQVPSNTCPFPVMPHGGLFFAAYPPLSVHASCR